MNERDDRLRRTKEILNKGIRENTPTERKKQVNQNFENQHDNKTI